MFKYNVSITSMAAALLPVLVQSVGVLAVLAYFSDESAIAIAAALGGILFFEATKSHVHTKLNNLRAIWGVLSKTLDNLAKELRASNSLLSKNDYEGLLEEELIIGDGGLNSTEHEQAASASAAADTIRSIVVVALNFFIAYHCIVLAISYFNK